jgi:hypothetical protein
MHSQHEKETALVRRQLRTFLERRGYDVASDSHGLKSDLYVVGDRDLARALFEFKASAQEARDSMYQGSWIVGMPVRFAVLPEAESQSPALEMLEQIKVVPLFYRAREGGFEFLGLDSLLTEHLSG